MTLKRVREKGPAKDATDLFRPLASHEEPSLTMQIEKVNAIGKRVLAIEEATAKLAEDMQRSLKDLQTLVGVISKQVGYIITGGIVVLIWASPFLLPQARGSTYVHR